MFLACSLNVVPVSLITQLVCIYNFWLHHKSNPLSKSEGLQKELCFSFSGHLEEFPPNVTSNGIIQIN